MKSVAEYRKAVVAAVGSALTLVLAFADVFPLPEDVSHVFATVVAIGTGVVTYLTRNDVVDVVDRY